jgi:hypothetical protein
MFHADIDGRSSLALDAIEAVRPYVEYWLFAYLEVSVFANRDFHELSDGEVRLSHPLNSHLAHTAALWRKACEPVAEWLAKSFDRASRIAEMRAALAPSATTASQTNPAEKTLPRLVPPLPTFITASHGRRSTAPSAIRLRAALRDDPVPRICWDCGRALTPGAPRLL